jgi:hypothetical protein
MTTAVPTVDRRHHVALVVLAGTSFVIAAVIASELSAPLDDDEYDTSCDLERIQEYIGRYVLATGHLPPSSVQSLPGIDGGACDDKDGTFQVARLRTWHSDPAWGAIDFAVERRTRYTFHWTRTSDTKGYATTVSDPECNGALSEFRVDYRVDKDGHIEVEARR